MRPLNDFWVREAVGRTGRLTSSGDSRSANQQFPANNCQQPGSVIKNSKYKRLEKDMGYTLVVDDDRYMLSMVKQVLECERIKAHCVASGEDALQKLEEMSFLLMITDLNMPGGMDGFELAKKTREIAPHMPIIMSTGDISPQIHCMAKEIGITEVLAKPFSPDKFVEIVKGVLEIEQKKAS